MKRIIFTLLILTLCQIVQAEDKIKHPSELNVRNLPVFIGWCGTGRPSYIKKEEVYPIVNDIFKSYGYNLQKDYKIKYNNIECELSGFDKKNKVGYIYGNWDNLDEDALTIWTYPRKGQELNLRALSHYLGKKYTQEVKKAGSIADKKKQQKFLWDLVNKYRKKKSRETISLEEIKFLPELYKRDNVFILFISQFDSRFAYNSSLARLRKKLNKNRKKAERLEVQKSIKRDIKKLDSIICGEANSKAAAIKNLTTNTKNALEWLKKDKIHD